MAFRIAYQRCLPLILLFYSVPLIVLSAGGAQESASADRGEYVAESDQIIAPDEIHIHSYIARIDFDYPDPTDSIDITIQSSHQRVSIAGQELLVQIGIQGRRGDFESIPPINIVFLFDASGSMSAPDKMDYVRISLDTLLERLRPVDTLSVIAFSENPLLVLPATAMSQVDREALREDIATILPLGHANLEAGYRVARSQISQHFDPEAVNRIVILSDGLIQAGEAVDLASEYFEDGVGTTTIGVGSNFNLELMIDLAKAGGGSSRFLTNRDKIHEVFFTDFDRAIFAVAHRLEMELNFLENVEILGHWGYNGVEDVDSITFAHPSVHYRDYETIMVRVRTPDTRSGTRPFATFKTRYIDREGRTIVAPKKTSDLIFSNNVVPALYPTDRRVLLGGTILDIALGLKDIGTLFYSMEMEQGRAATLRTANWLLRDTGTGEQFTALVSRETAELTQSQQHKIRRCLDITIALKHVVENVHLRLDTDIFESELKILNAYTKTLSTRLRISETVLEAMNMDAEVGLATKTGGFDLAIQAMAGELVATMGIAPHGVVFSGFTSRADGFDRIIERIDRVFAASMPRTVAKIASADLSVALSEYDAKETDLFDTEISRRIGESLGADLLVSGYLVPLSDSLIVFVRLIEVETGTVLSATQTVLNLTPELLELIND